MKDINKYTIVFISVMIVLGMSSALLFVRNPEGKQRNLLFYNSDDWFMDYFNTLSYIADRNPFSSYGFLSAI